MKKGMVKLVSGEKEQLFDQMHAERILNHRSNKGPGAWKLPEKSEFIFEHNELRRKPNKPKTSEAEV